MGVWVTEHGEEQLGGGAAQRPLHVLGELQTMFNRYHFITLSNNELPPLVIGQ